MKILNKYKIFSLLSAGILSLMTPISGYAAQTIQIEKTFTTTMENNTGTDLFDPIYEQNGVEYELSSVTAEVLSTETSEGETYIYKTAGVGSEEDLTEPEQTIEHNGKMYELQNYELKTEEVQNSTQYVERTVLYEGIDIDSDIPGFAEITETDALGNEVTEWLPLIDYTIEKENWDSSFEFPIKITNYDADSFLLNGTEIRKDEDLINYADEFLDYLNLPSEYYRIDSIEWNGGEYTENGIICRNATAKGDKMVMDVEALYGGEMSFGAGTMYYYECTYLNPDEPASTVYTVKSTGTYTEIVEETETETQESETQEEPIAQDTPNQGFFRQIIDWVVNNPIMALGIGTVVVIGIVVLVLFILSRRKKEEEKKKYDVVDIDQNDKK